MGLLQVLREQLVELVELAVLREQLEVLVEPVEAVREPAGWRLGHRGQTWPGAPFDFWFEQWCQWKWIQCPLQQLSWERCFTSGSAGCCEQ